jgi:hypothetical protein
MEASVCSYPDNTVHSTATRQIMWVECRFLFHAFRPYCCKKVEIPLPYLLQKSHWLQSGKTWHGVPHSIARHFTLHNCEEQTTNLHSLYHINLIIIKMYIFRNHSVLRQ